MEIDLLRSYPKTKRNTQARSEEKTPEVRAIARQFGEQFFDGERQYGYGGFNYNARFWQPVVPDLKAQYGLSANSNVLDVGCAKGFFLYDLQQVIPGIACKGIDISEYAIANAKPEVAELMQVGCASELPFEDNSFDLVMSVNTIHNLERDQCGQALQEITRVSRKNAFITVDAYRNEEEEARMYEWNLTAKTIMHVDEWKAFFKEVGYTGDYYWFIP
ncbi:class I SAM-dependent methyltransferase [Alteromonas sp. KUL49]|uniref:class I SAM-dependent methyltransferase n=1 Tax=Alteromonas sp. KUL49 TaxID=2480798 RepID=UPI00102F1F77|nr:class I SAM-dependent methyltransferase [Alteromonas sp. KUL49]TAP39684.1 class I SAM-dependent methyltransferase [Alteromonas sp. KUL49]GEA11672.1 methyltransferase [Alteromonas sp. KUL49]